MEECDIPADQLKPNRPTLSEARDSLKTITKKGTEREERRKKERKRERKID